MSTVLRTPGQTPLAFYTIRRQPFSSRSSTMEMAGDSYSWPVVAEPFHNVMHAPLVPEPDLSCFQRCARQAGV
jgi:hypothetical protein